MNERIQKFLNKTICTETFTIKTPIKNLKLNSEEATALLKSLEVVKTESYRKLKELTDQEKLTLVTERFGRSTARNKLTTTTDDHTHAKLLDEIHTQIEDNEGINILADLDENIKTICCDQEKLAMENKIRTLIGMARRVNPDEIDKETNESNQTENAVNFIKQLYDRLEHVLAFTMIPTLA